jgi:hypothetical protein
MYAATLMRSLPGYETNHGFATVEYLIFIMIQLNPLTVPYVNFFILKCTTIRLGLSVGIWGTKNRNANEMECPSYRAIMAIAKCFPPVGINYGKHGFPIGFFNARTKCEHKDGHCCPWKMEEGRFLASALLIFSWVCAKLSIPVIVSCFGGTTACAPLFRALKQGLDEFSGGIYSGIMTRFLHLIEEGTHVSNLVLRRRLTWLDPMKQVSGGDFIISDDVDGGDWGKEVLCVADISYRFSCSISNFVELSIVIFTQLYILYVLLHNYLR